MENALIMMSFALLCTAGAVFMFVRPARSEAAVYRQRIGGTMLAAGAILLTAYAWTLWSWSR